MYAIFTLLLLLLLLLLPADNADLLKINYGELLEQYIEIMSAYICMCLFTVDFDLVDCITLHLPYSLSVSLSLAEPLAHPPAAFRSFAFSFPIYGNGNKHQENVEC